MIKGNMCQSCLRRAWVEAIRYTAYEGLLYMEELTIFVEKLAIFLEEWAIDEITTLLRNCQDSNTLGRLQCEVLPMGILYIGSEETVHDRMNFSTIRFRGELLAWGGDKLSPSSN